MKNCFLVARVWHKMWTETIDAFESHFRFSGLHWKNMVSGTVSGMGCTTVDNQVPMK